MKLTGVLEAWREQQAMPTYHDLSFDERLALMVEREYIRRQNQRMQRDSGKRDCRCMPP
ncbi:hypothetical protein [Acaryochloris sp. CCMEE 5410]|uniref:hypothetical protein n=1 Tax=Acaryochloris sp. CCMEE 5410 TaxID=310037 RepID=UPI0021CE377D|nr:hypothetical protein [Acaryochloris sp. CCMEE 5410]